jgi:hypothetical protein
VQFEDAESKQGEPSRGGGRGFAATDDSMDDSAGEDEYSDDFETDSDDDERRSETLRQVQSINSTVDKQYSLERDAAAGTGYYSTVY